jgi:hypothetical protein
MKADASLASRRIRMMTDAPVEFGLIPPEHWVQPGWINETRAAEYRKKLVDIDIIYGGLFRLLSARCGPPLTMFFQITCRERQKSSSAQCAHVLPQIPKYVSVQLRRTLIWRAPCHLCLIETCSSSTTNRCSRSTNGTGALSKLPFLVVLARTDRTVADRTSISCAILTSTRSAI